jgi:hypothetical protein
MAIANRYFADLNAKNRTDARTLICSEELSEYDANGSSPDNDFTFTWTNISYQSVGAVESRITVLTYGVTLSRDSQSQPVTLRLYLVEQSGAKICGEAASV